MKTIALFAFLFCAACGASAPCRQNDRPQIYLTDGRLILIRDIGEARFACAQDPNESFRLYTVTRDAHRLVMACVGGQIIPAGRQRRPE